jgi:predicted dehydrogenase
MKLGILSAANIAYQKFLPALKKHSEIDYKGFSSYSSEKAKQMAKKFGGEFYDCYEDVLKDNEIQIIYIPLPPAMHYHWGGEVLASGKHVFMEKPFTCTVEETCKLIDLAIKKDLAIYENYSFLYHSQLDQIKKMVFDEHLLGDIRLYRMNFSFPNRGDEDFRYRKELGGGACLDCGGYPIRLAMEMLGDDLKIAASKLNYKAGCEVDIYGTVTVENEAGCVAQLAFGMDNGYHCDLEIYGQFGTIRAERIFTSPPDYVPVLYCNVHNQKSTIELSSDDQFYNSIQYFISLIKDKHKRKIEYDKILRQASFIQLIQDNNRREYDR